MDDEKTRFATVLAHDYLGTNPRVIFDTVTIFIPDLLERLRKVIAANG